MTVAAKLYFTYVLQSSKDSGFYIGQTDHLEKRLDRHNAGRVKSTKSRKPWRLVYSEKFKTRKEAVQRERYLKSLKGSNYFRSIIGL